MKVLNESARVIRDESKHHAGIWVVNPYNNDDTDVLFISDFDENGECGYWLFNVDESDVEKYGHYIYQKISTDLSGKYSTRGTSSIGYKRDELDSMLNELGLPENTIALIKRNFDDVKRLTFDSLEQYWQYVYRSNKYDLVEDLINYGAYTEKDRRKLMRMNVEEIKQLHYDYFLNESWRNLNESGYSGWSMSNNAVAAYESGEKPKSKWTKTDILDEVDYLIRHGLNVKFDINLLKKLPLEKLRTACLRCSSWHHTSSYYNETDFYSVSEDLLKELTNERIQELLDEKGEPKKVRDKTRKKATVWYSVWGGTRKHPKKYDYKEVCEIDDTWAFTSDGKKRLDGKYVSYELLEGLDDSKPNYSLRGLLKGNNKSCWIDFPISYEDYIKTCNSIGLDNDYYDNVVFGKWEQSDEILDLSNTYNHFGALEVLSDFVKETNDLTKQEYAKVLKIIEIEGTKSVFDLETFGIDINIDLDSEYLLEDVNDYDKWLDDNFVDIQAECCRYNLSEYPPSPKCVGIVSGDGFNEPREFICKHIEDCPYLDKFATNKWKCSKNRDLKETIEDYSDDEDCQVKKEDCCISMAEFVRSGFADDYYNKSGDIEAFTVDNILSNYPQKKANKDNFFKNSFAIFSDVDSAKEEEIRNAEPDYVSTGKSIYNSPSIYWCRDGGVYRLSDHWGGGIRTCDWYLNGYDAVDEMKHYDRTSEKGGTGNIYITDDLRAVIDTENIPQQINSYQELRELVRSIEKKYNIRVLCHDYLDRYFNELSLDEEEGDSSESTPIVGNKSVGGKLGFVKFEDIKFKDGLCRDVSNYTLSKWK